MITSPAFAAKRYCILGLARSGLATLDALMASGAQCTVWDNREEARETAVANHPDVQIGDPMEIDLAGFDGLIVSPGVPLNRHPVADRARAASVPIIGDIELFALARASLPPHRVIGITGTNGKSTTTALIHHIIREAGVPTIMGGNIGLPILSQPPLSPNDAGTGIYVLELSSYQIDLTFSLDCDVAVLLNITPDHLDRYDGFPGYCAAKARLFSMQQDAAHVAVIATDDEPTRTIAASLSAPIEVHASDISAEDQRAWPALQGPHNAQNVAVALAAVDALGLDRARSRASLATFSSLPHRMERTAEHRGVLYVNDSKATNPASTAPALAAYPRIHWIVGGLPKGDSLDECAPHFGHVVHAYTIGEAGPAFADQLEPLMPVTRAELMANAVRSAMTNAKAGEVVLLSPACASFDQFRDFEARGDSFRKIVDALIGEDATHQEDAKR
ncbi:UDP-N-acetylmuramoylalanine--D-glutamate ligase [Blastomonas natatoria]|uniref:UDP-N-acetylmuramoylalanine--D-glutamate ligase n=1 Tax=Blastomonas natatoria TaxID=34015 RepID=A0A2V3UYB3_9SPHN|nr:UDP-N-acetylmuramoyl-L-alanine--D-glutamate ligase [Blastomonas natatoria]PXW74363.1 UDP-N-acetylmuramoylalanine--D-glutamate ligase [Blastomonas natatoria]